MRWRNVDRAGQRLMLRISKPRRPHKDEDPQGLYWFEDEARLRRLYEYCKQDVEVEREHTAFYSRCCQQSRSYGD